MLARLDGGVLAMLGIPVGHRHSDGIAWWHFGCTYDVFGRDAFIRSNSPAITSIISQKRHRNTPVPENN